MAKRSKRQADLSQAQKLKMREKWRRQKARQRARGKEAYEEARKTGKPVPRNSGSFLRSRRFKTRKSHKRWQALGRPATYHDPEPIRRSRPQPFQNPGIPTTVQHISSALWGLISTLDHGGRTPNTQKNQDEAASTVAEPAPEARAEPPPRTPRPLNPLSPEDRAYLRALRGPPELHDFGKPPLEFSKQLLFACPDWLDPSKAHLPI